MEVGAHNLRQLMAAQTLSPAVHHDRVHLSRAARGRGEAVVGIQELNHLQVHWQSTQAHKYTDTRTHEHRHQRRQGHTDARLNGQLEEHTLGQV